MVILDGMHRGRRAIIQELVPQIRSQSVEMMANIRICGLDIVDSKGEVHPHIEELPVSNLRVNRLPDQYEYDNHEIKVPKSPPRKSTEVAKVPPTKQVKTEPSSSTSMETEAPATVVTPKVEPAAEGAATTESANDSTMSPKEADYDEEPMAAAVNEK